MVDTAPDPRTAALVALVETIMALLYGSDEDRRATLRSQLAADDPIAVALACCFTEAELETGFGCPSCRILGSPAWSHESRSGAGYADGHDSRARPEALAHPLIPGRFRPGVVEP